MSELEAELVPEEQEPAEQSVHQAWFDAAPREQQTRYLLMDLARMCNALPKEVVPVAVEMEKFLLGKRLKAVE